MQSGDPGAEQRRRRRRHRLRLIEDHIAAPIRSASDRPQAWLRISAAVRLAVLLVAALGAFNVMEPPVATFGFLAVYYAFGFVTSIGYFIAVRREAGAPPLLTWAQVLVDLAVVAATVALTGGYTSFFTFLFVVVILEATLLIGIADGFIYAALATAFMIMETMTLPAGTSQEQQFYAWYSLIVEVLAFFLTASISGFWHMRLRRLQQFQLEVLDHLNNGFLITDSEGTVAALNKAGEQVLGIDVGEASGRPVQEILRMQSGGECPVLTALRSERDFTSYEFQAITASGMPKLLGLTTSRIYDNRDHGKLTGVIASFSDLTDMDRMRRDLRRQDRLAVVGELAAGLAHEIRNPLAAIRGAVDEIRAYRDNATVLDKLTAIAMRESDQLNDIVTGFLDFARKPELRREVFDVVALVDEVTDILRRKYADVPEVVIETKYPDRAVTITADRSQIKQVFINIARNGVEAMHSNGRMAISVNPERTSAEVRFDDEGPGIDPDEVARIFEPFYTTKDEGVGMGLAVCQRIVTAHDGAIRVTSREGGGASIIVQLPYLSEED